jgi:lactate permease
VAGRILPPLSLILPLWLVRSMVGWRETWQVWPALLVSGASFATMQFYWSNFQEPGLVDIVSAIFSLLATVAFLKIWAPVEVMPVNGELVTSVKRHSTAAVLKGWSPFIVASVLIFLSGLPVAGRFLNFDALRMPMPFLHDAVVNMPPVVPAPMPEDATVNLNFVGIPSTVIFVSAVVAALLAGLPLRRTARLFMETVVQMMPSLLAISFMVGLAYVTRYAGLDTVRSVSA